MPCEIVVPDGIPRSVGRSVRRSLDRSVGLFVFLSNRIHPDAENRKLIHWNVRTELQQIVYESFGISDRFTTD